MRGEEVLGAVRSEGAAWKNFEEVGV